VCVLVTIRLLTILFLHKTNTTVAAPFKQSSRLLHDPETFQTIAKTTLSQAQYANYQANRKGPSKLTLLRIPNATFRQQLLKKCTTVWSKWEVGVCGTYMGRLWKVDIALTESQPLSFRWVVQNKNDVQLAIWPHYWHNLSHPPSKLYDPSDSRRLPPGDEDWSDCQSYFNAVWDGLTLVALEQDTKPVVTIVWTAPTGETYRSRRKAWSRAVQLRGLDESSLLKDEFAREGLWVAQPRKPEACKPLRPLQYYLHTQAKAHQEAELKKLQEAAKKEEAAAQVKKSEATKKKESQFKQNAQETEFRQADVPGCLVRNVVDVPKVTAPPAVAPAFQAPVIQAPPPPRADPFFVFSLPTPGILPRNQAPFPIPKKTTSQKPKAATQPSQPRQQVPIVNGSCKPLINGVPNPLSSSVSASATPSTTAPPPPLSSDPNPLSSATAAAAASSAKNPIVDSLPKVAILKMTTTPATTNTNTGVPVSPSSSSSAAPVVVKSKISYTKQQAERDLRKVWKAMSPEEKEEWANKAHVYNTTEPEMDLTSHLQYCLTATQVHQCYNAGVKHFNQIMQTVKSRDLQRQLEQGFDLLRQRGRGRYDMELPAFDSKAFAFLTDLKKAPWMPIVREILGPTVSLIHKGIFLSLPDAETQDYHQDGPHLSSQTHKPCHAINVFVPLVDLTTQGTEFCLGSHLLSQEDYNRKFLVTPKVKAGTPILFDYRLGHRGLANASDEIRPVVYCTYSTGEFRDSVNFSRRRYCAIGDLVDVGPSREERSKRRQSS